MSELLSCAEPLSQPITGAGGPSCSEPLILPSADALSQRPAARRRRRLNRPRASRAALLCVPPSSSVPLSHPLSAAAPARGRELSLRVNRCPRSGDDRGRGGKDRKTWATSAAVGGLPAAPAIQAFCAAISSAGSTAASLARFRRGPYSRGSPTESAEGRRAAQACVHASCVINNQPASPSVCALPSSTAASPL